MPDKTSFKTHEEYLDYCRKYREKNKDRLTIYNRIYNKKWRHTHGYKRDNVRARVFWAIKKGKLFRKPCVICGELKVQAHHEDYDKPLEVRWLCNKHHRARHQAIHKRMEER